MDIQAIVDQVEAWPVEDRLRLVERIWDGLLDRDVADEPTEAQKADLDIRLAEDDANPGDVVSWDEVEADALRRAGR